MSFTLHCMGQEGTFDHKIQMLDLIGDRDPDKSIIAVRVNNRVRELTYEISYDANIDLLTTTDRDACRIYEASLRYIVAMAFSRCYPDLKIRFSYNVSRAIGIHILNERQTRNRKDRRSGFADEAFPRFQRRGRQSLCRARIRR